MKLERPTSFIGKRGFTMVELIGVMVILGILAVTAVTRSFMSQQDLDGVAKSLRSNLQLAQDLAMTQGSIFGFHFLSSTQYQIFTGAAGTPATSPLDNLQFNVTISPVQFSGTPADIPFAKDGTPSIAADATIVLTDGTNTRTITVQQNTGFVTVTSP